MESYHPRYSGLRNCKVLLQNNDWDLSHIVSTTIHQNKLGQIDILDPAWFFENCALAYWGVELLMLSIKTKGWTINYKNLISRSRRNNYRKTYTASFKVYSKKFQKIILTTFSNRLSATRDFFLKPYTWHDHHQHSAKYYWIVNKKKWVIAIVLLKLLKIYFTID